jgi:hypothetical protein
MTQDVLFFRTPDLPPGRHVVEAVVHDGIAEKSTVLRTPIEVPVATPALTVGDIFVVSRVEPFAPVQPGAAAHPLESQGALYYPSFGEPVSKAGRGDLAFALPLVTTGQAPEASLELRQGGRTLATLPVPVEPPQADGRLMLVGRLPLAQIPPGIYELRVTVRVAAQSVSRATTATVTP